MRASFTQTRSSRNAALSNAVPLVGPLHVSVPVGPLVHVPTHAATGGPAGVAGFAAAAGGGAGLAAAGGGGPGGAAFCGSSLPQLDRTSATTSEERRRGVVMGPGLGQHRRAGKCSGA